MVRNLLLAMIAVAGLAAMPSAQAAPVVSAGMTATPMVQDVQYRPYHRHWRHRHHHRYYR